MNFRYVVRFNLESEGYRVWDNAEHHFVGGSFTNIADAQKVADAKNENAARQILVVHYSDGSTDKAIIPDVLADLHAQIAALQAELKLERQRSEEALAFVYSKLKAENARMKAAIQEAHDLLAQHIGMAYNYPKIYTAEMLLKDVLKSPAPTEAPATSEDES